jgi:hypothetical protein
MNDTTSRRTVLKGAGVLALTGALGLAVGTSTASAATHPSLAVGSHGAPVLALQKRLTALGYWNGKADGAYGDLTRQAVMALQKVAGLARDGACGPKTWAKIDAGIRPRARTTYGRTFYVDKATQTLRIENSGRVLWILNCSTGSGKKYTYTYQGKTHTSVALTPNCDQALFRRVKGMDVGPLGPGIYWPGYFLGGVAIHGYTDVPAVAASHGCVRVSYSAMDFLWGAGGLHVGSRVLVR